MAGRSSGFGPEKLRRSDISENVIFADIILNHKQIIWRKCQTYDFFITVHRQCIGPKGHIQSARKACVLQARYS